MPDSHSNALLVILDGFGIAEDPSVSAIDRAETPYIDALFQTWPNSRLSASGPDVGLPEKQFGNSEVGHLNIGAGRIVWQELSRINKAIDDGSFYENPVLNKTFQKAAGNGRIHFMGLFSDGGVHSTNEHLYALLKMAKKFDIESCWLHAFTDGRDTSPTGGINYYHQFKEKADEIGTGKLASVIGRYYAMDRDNRWERTEKAYRLLVHGDGKKIKNPEEAFIPSYEEGITDEFLDAHLIDSGENSRFRSGDVVIYFNIRGDRARQLTKALHRFDEVPFETEMLGLQFCSFTSYDDSFADHVDVAWPPADLTNTLGEFVSRQGLKQIRIAETEKYPHVTYFFNGGDETAYEEEVRIMVPSPRVATYDLKPEMSAGEVTQKLCEQLRSGEYNLAIVNYANPDMVGHTGIMEAAIKAVETIDRELQKVIETAVENHYKILVISDHGNADCMIQPDGSPNTAHTTAPVPAILIGEGQSKMHDGILADVAPTLLKMMGLSPPEEMTGKALY